MGEPQRIGPYEIILPIAKGGMATVFLARSEGLGGFDRYVALKLTAPALRSDPLFAKHLIEEGKLVAHLRHTNVVPVLDVGECDDGVYLVMEYVPGDSLSGLIRTGKASEGTLPLKVSMRVLCDALLGLHAAHEHTDEEGHSLKIVHRDFSPQNILVGTDGVAR
ncbi:MAG TPA: protein kinase, partial [Labilithrix sp.]